MGPKPEKAHMILTLDVGNTLTDMGFHEPGKPFKVARFKEKGRTEDEAKASLSLLLGQLGIEKSDITGAILCSVVPPLTEVYSKAIPALFGVSPLVMGPKLKTGVRIDVPVPSEVGNDLVASCAGAKAKYGRDCVIADLGTATKVIGFSFQRGFIGVSIFPGVGMSAESLSLQTAALPLVGLTLPPDPLGRNTVDAIDSGILYGTAAAIREIGAKIATHLQDPLFLLTGGYAEKVDGLLPDYLFDRDLVLSGLYSIYRRNKGE